MKRWLTRLLVLTLVPVLVIAGTNGRAAAATVYGPIVSATVGDIGLRGLDGWECNIEAYFTTTTPTPETLDAYIKGEFSCKTGSGTNDVRLYAMRFENESGNACRYESSFAGINIDEQDEQTGTFVAIRLDGPAMCGPVTRVCIHAHREIWGGSDSWHWECSDIPMGHPPVPEQEVPSACTIGTMVTPKIRRDVFTWGTTSQVPPHPDVDSKWVQWQDRITFTMRNATADAVKQTAYVLYPDDPGRTGHTGDGFDGRITSTGFGTFFYKVVRFGAPVGGVAKAVITVRTTRNQGKLVSIQTTDADAAAALGPAPEPVGLGVGYNASSLALGFNSTAYASTPLGSYSAFYGGRHDPPACIYFWGAKVVNVSNNTDDGLPPPAAEPYDPTEPDEEPINVEPDPAPPAPDPDGETEPPPGQTEDDACGEFSLWDPTSWASGGICVLVYAVIKLLDVMGEILKAILGLAETIATAIIDGITSLLEAILDGLAALFIPDGDLLSGHIDGLSDVFDNSPAGDWSTALEGGFGGAPGGGCEGPAFDPPAIAGADLPHMAPFSACGEAASAASITRTVLTLAVSLSGGFLILRMILTSLGIRTASPSIGGGKE